MNQFTGVLDPTAAPVTLSVAVDLANERVIVTMGSNSVALAAWDALQFAQQISACCQPIIDQMKAPSLELQ